MLVSFYKELVYLSPPVCRKKDLMVNPILPKYNKLDGVAPIDKRPSTDKNGGPIRLCSEWKGIFQKCEPWIWAQEMPYDNSNPLKIFLIILLFRKPSFLSNVNTNKFTINVDQYLIYLIYLI